MTTIRAELWLALILENEKMMFIGYFCMFKICCDAYALERDLTVLPLKTCRCNKAI